MFVPLTLALALVAILACRGQARTRVLLAALGVLFLASWPPTVWLAAATLESRYRPEMPPPVPSSGAVDAIVVLSGYMERSPWGGPPTPGLDTYGRLVYAVALHERWRQVPIVVTGGRLLGPDEPPIAAVMAAYLEQRGVPRALVEQEPRARNTHENALYTARLLHRDEARPGQLQVAVVTDARHMLRASLAFAKEGLEVVPAACCFATRLKGWDWTFLRPSWWSLETMNSTVHEWLGLLVYRARGWI